MTKQKNELKTAKEVAELLGINRTTLVRMHSSGRIPECKAWGGKGTPHRLYDENEVKAISKLLENRRPRGIPEGVKLVKDL